MRELRIKDLSAAEKSMESICSIVNRRLQAHTKDACPVELSSALLHLAQAQSCGKCVPCRIGLGALADLLDKILDGKANIADLEKIEQTCRSVAIGSDCAIGSEAGKMLQVVLPAFKEDFISHIEHDKCTVEFNAVPCVRSCPANVDVPGYIALVKEGNYQDAVRLIRKDNPFPSVCALVCEHPCEKGCRRNLVDAAINIRALKRYAVDNAGIVPAKEKLAENSKKIAVVGGGPSGLSAAYYLALMGYEVTVFEKRKRLGGMLRYGIPSYRLPDEYLDRDIDNILSLGIKVELEADVGGKIDIQSLREKFDSVYIAIGAHKDKKLGIANDEAVGVMSAVELLRTLGDGGSYDFSGKNVVVVGGGNVAMDVTRTSRRLGAKNVTCVYRRRIEDMTALADEIEGAIAEGCEILPLMAPAKVEVDENNLVKGLVVAPQVIGEVKRGRPAPYNADKQEELLVADIIIVAIGQDIESKAFGEAGLTLERNNFKVDETGKIVGVDGVFAGGECQFGAATVIRAIEAGKVAAANIDRYLGMNTELTWDIQIPPASFNLAKPCGRVNTTEIKAKDRADNFNLMEIGMSEEEAKQECSRCLRCDHYGRSAFRGGNNAKW